MRRLVRVAVAGYVDIVEALTQNREWVRPAPTLPALRPGPYAHTDARTYASRGAAIQPTDRLAQLSATMHNLHYLVNLYRPHEVLAQRGAVPRPGSRPDVPAISGRWGPRRPGTGKLAGPLATAGGAAPHQSKRPRAVRGGGGRARPRAGARARSQPTSFGHARQRRRTRRTFRDVDDLLAQARALLAADVTDTGGAAPSVQAPASPPKRLSVANGGAAAPVPASEAELLAQLTAWAAGGQV